VSQDGIINDLRGLMQDVVSHSGTPKRPYSTGQDSGV
jgi:hypothetical protein